jgi:2-polyprenyl-3-methyl-5-hydroxy-6-metoxy-1,4-benzoquinol methylase
MKQTTYSDEHLQNHELNYWLNGFNPPLHHHHFYNEFFPFESLNSKKTVEVGCGGSPITEYTKATPDLTLIDPLLDKLVSYKKYEHLSQYKIFSQSLLDFKEKEYDYAVCLNVIDHFNDPECSFVDVFYNMLNKDGELWLYYDVRSKDDGDHLALNDEKIQLKIKDKFNIKKIDLNINPIHKGWSSVYKSVRLIATKK